MSFINHKTKEIHFKIVYYGPSLSGKTTNVQWIYEKTNAENKSEIVELPGDLERTVFFDFLPMSIGEIRGFKARFHLYSVPGQVVFDSSRRLILKGLDGIIFVADSQKERLEENLESMSNLELNLQKQGYELKKIPHVIQYNKRELPNSMPVHELSKVLNKYNAAEFEAEAIRGKGVFESLKSISKSIITLMKGGSL